MRRCPLAHRAIRRLSLVTRSAQGYSERREVVQLQRSGVRKASRWVEPGGSRRERSSPGPWRPVLAFGSGLAFGLVAGAYLSSSPIRTQLKEAGRQAREVGADVVEQVLTRPLNDGNSVALSEESVPTASVGG